MNYKENTGVEFMEGRDENQYPRMRAVEAFPVTVENRTMFMLRDPDHLVEKSVIVPYKTLFLTSLFNGRNSIREIQAAYNRKFGELIFSNRIQDIMFELDAAMMLDNSRYRQYLEFLRAQYRTRKSRPAAHKGNDYPEDPAELERFLNNFFKKLPDDPTNEPPLGIISPHIDFYRGGEVYAQAYRQLKKSQGDLFVILGTSHRPLNNIVSLTDKDFETPLGEVPAHRDFMGGLRKKLDFDCFSDELSHRTEHSIEFQALMLRYIFPRRKIKIIPVLVDSMDHLGPKTLMPAEDPAINRFILAFKQMIEEMDLNPIYIAGADLAHVGRFFGDRRNPAKGELLKLKTDEIKSLSFLEKPDPEGFFSHVMADQDYRKVCGLAPVYLMMKLMDPRRGRILDYRQCCSDDGDNNVTITAMSFY